MTGGTTGATIPGREQVNSTEVGRVVHAGGAYVKKVFAHTKSLKKRIFRMFKVEQKKHRRTQTLPKTNFPHVEFLKQDCTLNLKKKQKKTTRIKSSTQEIAGYWILMNAFGATINYPRTPRMKERWRTMYIFITKWTFRISSLHYLHDFFYFCV